MRKIRLKEADCSLSTTLKKRQKGQVSYKIKDVAFFLLLQPISILAQFLPFKKGVFLIITISYYIRRERRDPQNKKTPLPSLLE